MRFILFIVFAIWLFLDVLEEYKHPDMIYPETNKHVELDVFVVNDKLAFEFQGYQHFRDMKYPSFSFLSLSFSFLFLFYFFFSLVCLFYFFHEFRTAGNPQLQHMRDITKKKICEEHGITLIEVHPYPFNYSHHFNNIIRFHIGGTKNQHLLLKVLKRHDQILY